MELIIHGEPKEIAAFVLELQKRREGPCKIETTVDLNEAFTSALEAIRDRPEATEG